MFVGGWSWMWASSLDLIPRLPISLYLALMATGLGCRQATSAGMGSGGGRL